MVFISKLYLVAILAAASLQLSTAALLDTQGYKKDDEFEHNEFFSVPDRGLTTKTLHDLIHFVGGNVSHKDHRYTRLTMQSSAELRKLASLVETIVSNATAGDVYETCCWRGGTSLFLAGVFELLDSPRHYYLFDSF